MFRNADLGSVVLTVLALAAAPALADDCPEPNHCRVIPADAMNGVILAPEHPTPLLESVLHITVLTDMDVPLVGAVVTVTFPASIRTCPDAMLQGVTDANGQVEITLSGGGCVSGATGACVMRAVGVEFRNYENAKSPDWDGTASNGDVNAGDYLRFALAFNGGTQGGCFDYDNSGPVGPGDFGIMARAFNSHNHCP